MAISSTGKPPGGSGDDAQDALPPVPPPARQESILPACSNDQATVDDTLGFTPYVKALASFLTDPATKPPLAISIEGEWGSGKSSFIRQLEKQITEREKARKSQTRHPRPVMVRFNPWRHDKEEALWVAFALDFLRQVREQRRFVPRWWCEVRLFFGRWSWSLKSWRDLVRALVLWLCYLSVPIAVVLLALFRGNDYIHKVVVVLTKQPSAPAIPGWAFRTTDWAFRITGASACLALVAYLLKYVKRLVGSPLEVDLKKHQKAPRYEGSVSFVERFHHDFPRSWTRMPASAAYTCSWTTSTVAKYRGPQILCKPSS